MKKRNRLTPRWVWLFMAVVSGIIGATFVYYLTILPFHGLWKTRAGVQVPAVIKKWDLNVSKASSKSAASVSVNAEYDYRYAETNYTGTRVSLFKYDNQVYYEHLDKTETLCFIDPNDPSYSVIDRRFSFSWLLFVLVVPTILLLFCFISISAFFKKSLPTV